MCPSILRAKRCFLKGNGVFYVLYRFREKRYDIERTFDLIAYTGGYHAERKQEGTDSRDSFFRILGSTEKVECEPFVRAGVLYVTAYLRHEQIAPLLRMLESERFHEPAAEEAWQRMMFADPIAHETKVFELLAGRGEIRETDAGRLAGEYHGIIMLGYFTGDTGRMARDLAVFYNRVFSEKGEDEK